MFFSQPGTSILFAAIKTGFVANLNFLATVNNSSSVQSVGFFSVNFIFSKVSFDNSSETPNALICFAIALSTADFSWTSNLANLSHPL